ncbi:transcriptional adapter 2-alpha-like [Hetaerina americana]|uniref:transcriptional adapter 2-alpha-like n=1 Tax=Hetaerina americana TaxID=62018 RepID=UPI003A7F38BD
MADNNLPRVLCCYCLGHLQDVYSYCINCPENTILCQHCIAKGVEFRCHHNNHETIMMRVDMPVLEVGWTAAEELNLLDALVHHGPNDWVNVSKSMDSMHSAKEIKEHYLRAYQNDHHFRINPAYIAHRANLHDPPRFTSTSILHGAFSGYNAARGDFQTDYDNDAEHILSSLDPAFIYEPVQGWSDEERRLGSELIFAVVDNYNKHLIERKRRHETIREHGLIHPQKNVLWLRRYDDSNLQWGNRGGDRQFSSCLGVSSQLVKTLTKFTQFLSGQEMDKLLEGLKLEADLRASLNELYELRRNGVTNYHMSSVYKRYCHRQEEFLKERRKYLLNPFSSWKNACDGRAGKFPRLVNQPRRPAPPLNISKLPGCDKLSAKERELCSVARFVPDSFIEFKNILVAACIKEDGLRLLQARALIKIDVNKTRKLYDFLIEEGAIYHPLVCQQN